MQLIQGLTWKKEKKVDLAVVHSLMPTAFTISSYDHAHFRLSDTYSFVSPSPRRSCTRPHSDRFNLRISTARIVPVPCRQSSASRCVQARPFASSARASYTEYGMWMIIPRGRQAVIKQLFFLAIFLFRHETLKSTGLLTTAKMISC